MCPGVNTFLAREIWTAVNGIMRSRGAAVAPPESFGVSGSSGMRVGRCQRDGTARGPSVEHQTPHGYEEGMDFIFWMWPWAGWGLDSVLEVFSSLGGSGIPGSPQPPAGCWPLLPGNIKDRRKQPHVAPGEV